MNFDDRNAAGANGVVKSDGCVGVTCGVEDDANEAFIGGTTDTCDEFAFVVGLHELDVDIFACRDCPHSFFDISKRRRSVDGSFSFSQPVEIGAGDDENTTTRC